MDITTQVPKYDGTESMTKYLRRVDCFKLKFQEDKYKLLLEFVNEWLKLSKTFRLKSLSDFVNVEENVLLADKKHNRVILRKYSENIIKKLNVEFDVEEETGSDDIEDTYIIQFVGKALSSIDFSLNKRPVGKKTYYSIKIR